MRHSSIFLKLMCLVVLLGSAAVVCGQTKLTGGGELSGNYQIQGGNLTINTSIVVKDGKTLTLDLNGYVLTGNLANGGYVLKVESGGKLIIKDSTPTLGHQGYLDEKGVFVWPYVEGKTKVVVPGGIIYNVQKDGKSTKGILVEGTCTIEKAKIMGCRSVTSDTNFGANGAAVTISSGGFFEMKAGEVCYNLAENMGGAIYGEPSHDNEGSEIKLTNSIISHNQAKIGAGVYGYNITLSQCEFKYNSSSQRGGAMYVTKASNSQDAGNLDVNLCTFSYNYAGIDGGGIYSKVPTEINNSEISYNYAMTSEIEGQTKQDDGRGGGFYFTGNGVDDEDKPKEPIVEFTLNNTNVINNMAMYYGGGGQVCNGAKLTLTSGKINDNYVILHGAGALHFTSSAIFEFNGGQISGNEAQYAGGAIHSSYSCQLKLNGGEIVGNTINGRGGGVHVNTGGDLVLNGTVIKNNEAKKGKEYKYATIAKNEDGSYTYVRDETADYRVDTGYGGGIFIDSGTCTMKRGKLTQNKSEVGGGGVALAMINMPETERILQLKTVEFILENGIVEDNTTKGDGAGIYIMKNKSKENFEKLSQEIQDSHSKNYGEFLNTLFAGVPKAQIEGGTLSENIAEENGGALYVNGDVDMTDGEFTRNSAKNGGGICIAGGEVSITKGGISENIASQYGGGIYVENDDAGATIIVAGEGQFENNKAEAGGGMAVKGPFTFNFQGSIQNNSAQNGGGIYLLPGDENIKGTRLVFKGGFIRNNIASSETKIEKETAFKKDVTSVVGIGGGVFMSDYTSLSFSVDDKQQIGFYGNQATNAADDIFANANSTNVILPDVSNMTLTDFVVPVPGNALYWVEDYVVDDTEYSEGTNKKGVSDPIVRYRTTLTNPDLKSFKVESGDFEDAKTKYLCLALGYKIIYASIQKSGLEDGESAIFNVYNMKDSSSPNLYATIRLTGKAEKNQISKKIALTEGNWKVEETGWSWTYTSDHTSVEKTISEGADNTFTFTNTKNDNYEKKTYDESIKVNKMGQSTE